MFQFKIGSGIQSSQYTTNIKKDKEQFNNCNCVEIVVHKIVQIKYR